MKNKQELLLENQSLKRQLQNYRSALNRVNGYFVNTPIESSLEEVDDYEFELFNVYQTSYIQEFIENVANRPYRVGSCYYELIKKETVQADKNICIQNTRNGKLYSGKNARKLLGLPNYSVQVEPKLIEGYRVFVQSNSHNRKLLKGQRLVMFN